MSKQDVITAPTESRFQIDVENNWTESSKTSALMKELEALQLTKDKSVVFSQWTAFLDLLEIPLKRYATLLFPRICIINKQSRILIYKPVSKNCKTRKFL